MKWGCGIKRGAMGVSMCPCQVVHKQPRSPYVVCGGIRGGGRRRCHLGCHVGVLSCKVDNGWPPVSIYYMHKSKVSQAVSVHLFGTACKQVEVCGPMICGQFLIHMQFRPWDRIKNCDLLQTVLRLAIAMYHTDRITIFKREKHSFFSILVALLTYHCSDTLP